MQYYWNILQTSHKRTSPYANFFTYPLLSAIVQEVSATLETIRTVISCLLDFKSRRQVSPAMNPAIGAHILSFFTILLSMHRNSLQVAFITAKKNANLKLSLLDLREVRFLSNFFMEKMYPMLLMRTLTAKLVMNVWQNPYKTFLQQPNLCLQRQVRVSIHFGIKPNYSNTDFIWLSSFFYCSFWSS